MQTNPATGSRYTQVVICATQRSGSTALCEDMARTGVLGHPNEHFINWRPENGKDWHEEANRLIERASTPNGIFSAKIMANQLRPLEACLATFMPPGPDLFYPHIMNMFFDARWIWVRRADTLDQAISHYLASKSGVYHVTRGTAGFVPGAAVTEPGFARRVGDQEPPFDFDEIMAVWQTIHQQNMVWEQFFEMNGIGPLIVSYDEISSGSVASKIGDAVGVGVPAHELDRNLVKMPATRNRVIRQKIVAELFRRT